MRKKITSNYLLSLVTATKESKKKKNREREREKMVQLRKFTRIDYGQSYK